MLNNFKHLRKLCNDNKSTDATLLQERGEIPQFLVPGKQSDILKRSIIPRNMPNSRTTITQSHRGEVQPVQDIEPMAQLWRVEVGILVLDLIKQGESEHWKQSLIPATKKHFHKKLHQSLHLFVFGNT
jgi:hypothetical protein